MNDYEEFFEYCKNEVTLDYPKEVPFELFDFQKRLIETCSKNRFVVGSKFRQGGFTTTMSNWLYWNCLSTPNTKAMFVTKTDRMCMAARWTLKRGDVSTNHHQVEFDNGSTIYFGTPISCCGRSMDYLFLDEMSFAQDMDTHWKALLPACSYAKNVTILSTRNKPNDWFDKLLHEAWVGDNKFKVFYANYKEHPKFATEEWEKETRQNIGKYFRPEFDQLL